MDQGLASLALEMYRSFFICPLGGAEDISQHMAPKERLLLQFSLGLLLQRIVPTVVAGSTLAALVTCIQGHLWSLRINFFFAPYAMATQQHDLRLARSSKESWSSATSLLFRAIHAAVFKPLSLLKTPSLPSIGTATASCWLSIDGFGPSRCH